MASGIFYLRPNSDISIEHENFNLVLKDDGTTDSDASSLLPVSYTSINEEVSDGASTIINANCSDGVMTQDGTWDKTSVFGLGGEIPNKITQVKSAKIYTSYNAVTGTGENIDFSWVFELITTVNGTNIITTSITDETSDSEYVLKSVSLADLCNAINQYISNNGVGSFPNITLGVHTKITTTANVKTTNTKLKVSQVYLELECEYTEGFNIHTKSNGTWKQAQKAFQKKSGAWVEITEDECKSILQGNHLKNG